MALSIKNEDTHRLVAELAKLTGESQAEAVRQAVIARLRQVRAHDEALVQRLLTIGKDCASRLRPPHDTIDHADLLYGEDGLPK